jgi:hypothetical protein
MLNDVAPHRGHCRKGITIVNELGDIFYISMNKKCIFECCKKQLKQLKVCAITFGF